jgi:hypothetical protein
MPNMSGSQSSIVSLTRFYPQLWESRSDEQQLTILPYKEVLFKIATKQHIFDNFDQYESFSREIVFANDPSPTESVR